MWYVYIIQCTNNKLYTGITNDLEKRFEKHKKGKGAWFTRVFGAEKIVYSEQRPTKGEAFKREREIKSWKRKEKLALIENQLCEPACQE